MLNVEQKMVDFVMVREIEGNDWDGVVREGGMWGEMLSNCVEQMEMEMFMEDAKTIKEQIG